MKIRIPRPRQFGSSIRELARRRPDQAEEYLDTHQDAWEELAGLDPHDAADILEALDEAGAADLLMGLGTENAGEVLDEMRPESAADVLEELQPSDAMVMLAQMEPDQAADVVAGDLPMGARGRDELAGTGAGHAQRGGEGQQGEERRQ